MGFLAKRGKKGAKRKMLIFNKKIFKRRKTHIKIQKNSLRNERVLYFIFRIEKAISNNETIPIRIRISKEKESQ